MIEEDGKVFCVKTFMKEMKDTGSVFDLAALCISHLERVTEPRQAEFIGTYCQENRGEPTATNPNFVRLMAFADEAKNVLEGKKALSLYEGVREALAVIISRVKIAEQPPISQSSASMNQASILYFLLSTLDQCAAYWRDCWPERSYGPLNQTGKYELAVYFIQRAKLLDEATLRTVPEQAGFNAYLRNLAYLRRQDWDSHKEYPQVVGASPALDDLAMSWKTKKNRSVRIAVVPYGTDASFSFETVKGSTFRAEYKDNKEAKSAERLIHLLEAAIREQANFILFPEYAISPASCECISEWLSQQWKNHRNEMQHLVAVLAGSTWMQEGDADNNVMHLFSKSGKRFGLYYKAAPYRKDEDDEHHIERLTHPGRFSTLLFVDGLGLIQPSICRDIIDREHVATMTYLFHPSFLLTASYSQSVEGFDPTYRELATQRHCVCLMCNHCASIMKKKTVLIEKGKRKEVDGREKVGLCMEPCLEVQTRPSAHRQSYYRTEECVEHCMDGGCFFLADLDFMAIGISEKQIVNMKQILLPKNMIILLRIG